jgi:SAM-dependent methyltransferase
MRSFCSPGSFDLILNLFTSFGYFEDKCDDTIVLNNIYKSLKKGGKFVIDTMSKERLAKIYMPSFVNKLDDGSLIVQNPTIKENWTRVKNEWIVIRGSNIKRFYFEHTIYSAQELIEKIASAGFSNIKAYGNYDGSLYDNNAERLVIAADKI